MGYVTRGQSITTHLLPKSNVVMTSVVSASDVDRADDNDVGRHRHPVFRESRLSQMSPWVHIRSRLCDVLGAVAA